MRTERFETLPWLRTAGLHELVQQWERGWRQGQLGALIPLETRRVRLHSLHFVAVQGCVKEAAIVSGNRILHGSPQTFKTGASSQWDAQPEFAGILVCSFSRGNEGSCEQFRQVVR